MSSKNVIGSLSASSTGEFEWLINTSSDAILRTNECINSPTFFFSLSSWFVKMYPKGFNSSCKKWISLTLVRKVKNQSEIDAEFSLEIKLQGMQLMKRDGKHIFKGSDSKGWFQFMPRKRLLNHRFMKTKDCCQLTVKIRMSHNVPLKEETLLENRMEGIKVLCENFKDLLLHGKGHDLILNVNNKEFKVHRIVMQCRCPVFKSVLDPEMLEKNGGVVKILDCDPLAFEQFLFYVYTGNLKELDGSFMPGLYYIANKFDMACLKEMCRDFLKKSLSVRNVCDVIKLALKHSDSSLLECGKKYYIDNVKKVIMTVEWQSFMRENPTHANVLFIKTINNYLPGKKIKHKKKLKRQRQKEAKMPAKQNATKKRVKYLVEKRSVKT